jgi:Domain of unknown function (DUF4129)
LIRRVRTRARLLATALLLALAIVRPFAASADEVARPAKSSDLDGFVHDLDDLTATIKASDAAGARAIAASLPPAWRVRHGNEEFIVATDWIAGPLRQGAAHPQDWTKARDALLARINVMYEQATDLHDAEDTADPASTPDAARRALHEVLARPEFKQGAGARPGEDLRSRILRWVASFLGRLPISNNATVVFSKVFAWIVALGAIAALVTYLLRVRFPQRTLTPLAIEAPRPTSAHWIARAYAALRAGDAREALHCGYHAVLFRLEEQGVWRVDESRTPREYVRLLPATDARRAAFVDLTRHFEQTWYGSRVADGSGLPSQLEAFGCSAPSNRAI